MLSATRAKHKYSVDIEIEFYKSCGYYKTQLSLWVSSVALVFMKQQLVILLEVEKFILNLSAKEKQNG